MWKALSVIIAMMALAYDISPLDLSSNTIPVLGWLDDAGITLVAALNAYHQFAKRLAFTISSMKYWCTRKSLLSSGWNEIAS